METIKKYTKYIVGAFVGAFLTIAAMTATPVDDMVGKYVSSYTGVTVAVSPTEVLK